MVMKKMSEQEQERDLWLRRFYEGKINLADLIFFTLQSGAPANREIFDLYAKALTEYDAGGDIETLLGLHQVKGTTVKRWELKAKVTNLVEDSKKPKTDPSCYDNTAFHEVGKKVHLSPSRVYDIYRGK